MYCKIILLSFTSFVIRLSDSARILGIIATPSYSHQVAFQPLWRELSLRGHQLTVLTTDPLNDPSLTNLTEIDLSFSYEVWNKNVLEMFKFSENFLISLNKAISTVTTINDEQLQHPSVQALIKNKTEHFDLLILELIPSMLAFAGKFNCPIISVVSLDASPLVYKIFGNPVHPILNPDPNLPFVGELTFVERLISTAFHVFFNFYTQTVAYPLQQEVINKHFGKHHPNMATIAKNFSMLFVNTDNIFHRIRPLVPAVVQIGGGTHRHAPQPLPKNLQTLLDAASQGFIYFSLGSNVKSTDLPESTQNVLLDVFATLPYLVLWKFELEDLPNKPKNVFISKWFPQQDVLRHPNLKVFITQGGQQSIEEAIYNYVPIIGMPFFGDQLGNVKKIVHKGLGLSIDRTTLDRESLMKTILEVISNPKYRNRVQELADLVLDQPMTGLEKAVWWTEYVLRHKGAHHLKSPMINIPFYQYFLLDVIGFCLLVVLLIFYLLIRVIKVSFRLVKYVAFKPKEKAL